MSMPVNLSNNVYNELKQIKTKEGKSFSEVIEELLAERQETKVEKNKGTKEMMEFIRQLEADTPKGKKVDYCSKIDEIVYGV